MSRPRNLWVDQLTVATRDEALPILSNVTLELRRGRLTAVVGESGSGKTTLLSAILGLLPEGLLISGGAVLLGGAPDGKVLDLTCLEAEARRQVLGRRIGYVPQDCAMGLDPILQIGKSMEESLRCHRQPLPPDARELIGTALVKAGLSESLLDSYRHRRPSGLSGGQLQRVLIAKARLNSPEVVLYDEPSTALDPVAKKVLLDSIRASIGSNDSALVVSHDLMAMRHYADHVYVLYRGEVVEEGEGRQVLERPRHPYTLDLLRTLPRIDRQTEPRPIPGALPTILDTRKGCLYHSRCATRIDACFETAPELETAGGDHRVRCHVWQ